MNWKKIMKKRGMGINSFIEISSFDGLRRKYRMNRTSIRLKLRRKVLSRLRPLEIILPCSEEEGDFELRWKNLGDERGVFEVLSLGDIPFMHNGAMVSQAYLMERDQLEFDFNRFICLSEDSNILEEDLSLKGRWPENIPLLIEGETGVGKSSLAKKIHEKYSLFEGGAFVGINLSALNAQLIESELFGHEKGSFTGAIRQKKGAVELAERGTLFLDEIDSLEKSMQVKLLTFLDDRNYRRVGGEVELKAHCRIIFATGRNLKKLVKRGEFRSDLYYRITSGQWIHLKPLREQTDVIHEFLKSFEREKSIVMDDDLLSFYKKCLWPGNYRQLSSHLMRKYAGLYPARRMSLCEIDADLERGDSFESGVRGEDVLDFVKRAHCTKVFLQCRGNYTQAAQVLKISKSTLRRLMKMAS